MPRPGKLSRLIDETKSRIGEEEQQQRQFAVALEQATARLPEVADDQAAYAECEQTIAGCRSELGRFDRLLERRRGDLAELERQLAHARFEDACSEREKAAHAQVAQGGAVAKQLKDALAGMGKLVELRAATDEATACADELRPDDAELPALADEPDWPDGVGELEAFIAVGPRQPKAEEVANSAKLEEHQRQRDSEQIRNAVNSGPSMIAKLPEPLRVEAQRRWDALATAAREKRDRERVAAGMPPIDTLEED
jgi:hypothetical protein